MTLEQVHAKVSALMDLTQDSCVTEVFFNDPCVKLTFRSGGASGNWIRDMLVIRITEGPGGWYARSSSTTMPSTTEDYKTLGRAYSVLSNPDVFGLGEGKIVAP